jgi:hypothetical protein
VLHANHRLKIGKADRGEYRQGAGAIADALTVRTEIAVAAFSQWPGGMRHRWRPRQGRWLIRILHPRRPAPPRLDLDEPGRAIGGQAADEGQGAVEDFRYVWFF